MSFSWQTEDEPWDEPSGPEEPRPGGWRARWPLFLALILLLLAGGWLLRRQLTRRVEEVSSVADEDVASSVRLVRQAVAQGDRELLATLLSGSDAAWTEAQQALLKEHVLLERSVLGLDWLPGASTIQDISLSPDFTQAEVNTVDRYAVQVGNGVTETVQLQHAETYRLGRERWLLAKGEGFPWGKTETWTGQYLLLHYPSGDQALALRLAADVEAKLGEMCATLADVRCPESLQLQVWLSTDPASLAELARPAWALRSDLEINLPAPSLVGTPVSERDYQALYRAYAVPLLSVAIRQAAAWECCDRLLFFQALLDRQLSQLGVQPWPLGPGDYRRILDHPFLPRDIHPFWATARPEELRGEESWRVWAVLDFLFYQNPGLTAGALQRALPAAHNYWQWLAPHLLHPDSLSEAWVRFAQERAGLSRLRRPLPYPEQVAMMICTGDPVQDGAEVMRYRPADRSFATVMAFDQAQVTMTPLPDDAGILFMENPRRFDQGAILFIWQVDGSQLSVHLPEGVPEPAQFQPLAGDDLLANAVPVRITSQGQPFQGLAELDLESCQEGACPMHLLDQSAYLLPSPGGESRLQVDFFKRISAAGPPLEMNLVDAAGRSLGVLGPGRFPFWLDAGTLGYVREAAQGAETGFQVVTVDAGSQQAQVWLEQSDFGRVIAPDRPNLPLSLQQLWLDPASRRWMLFDLLLPEQGVHQWLLLDLQSGSLRRFYRTGLTAARATFSPDGRSLAVAAFDPTRSLQALVVAHLEQGKARQFSSNYPLFLDSYDWSADGQWLVRGDESFLAFYAPAFDYQEVVPLGRTGCGMTAWLDDAP